MCFRPWLRHAVDYEMFFNPNEASYAQVLEEYEEEEIRKLVDVATAPPARPSSEAPRLLRGASGKTNLRSLFVCKTSEAVLKIPHSSGLRSASRS